MLATYYSLFTLTTLLSAVSAQTRDFSGLGQVRTLYINDDNEDLGCLTSDGRWTVDEPQCGTFTSVRADNGSFQLAAGAGPCGIANDGFTFTCGGNIKATVFDTFGTGSTDSPVPGREVLRYRQYGIFATDAPDSPPLPGDKPLVIRFYGGGDKGKYAWLGWTALTEDEDAEE